MHKVESKTFLLLSTLICIYIVLRAICVPVLHDEASNFFVNVQHGEFIPFYSDWEAGNHFFNTFLTSSLQWLFGDSLFIFRLASLLFLPVYLLYIWKLSHLFNNSIIRWVFILTFVLNTYLIEFFALGRGYGMSIALLLGGLYYLFEYLRLFRRSALIKFCLFLTFATAANLTMVLPFALISFYLGIQTLINEDHPFRGKRITSIVFWSGIPIVLFGGLGVLMNRLGVLYYGIKTSIWEATVKSLLKAFVQTNTNVPQIIVAGLFIFALVTSIIYLVRNRKIGLSDLGLFSIYFFFGLIIASFIMRFTFDTNFAEDRTALYFFPAFIILFLLLIDRIPKLKILGGIFLLFPILFFVRANMNHSTYWGYQQIDQFTFDYIKEKAKESDEIPTVGMYSISVINWFYFNYSDGETMIPLADCDAYPGGKSDFLLIDKSKLKGWEKNYREINYWGYSKISLLERKEKLIRRKIFSMTIDLAINKDSPHQTQVIKEFTKDDTKDYYAEFNFFVNSNGKTARSAIHFDVIYPEDSVYRKHGIPLNWVRRTWDNNQFKAGVILQDLPPGKESINFTLLNNYHDSKTEIKGEVTLWELVAK